MNAIPFVNCATSKDQSCRLGLVSFGFSLLLQSQNMRS